MDTHTLNMQCASAIANSIHYVIGTSSEPTMNTHHALTSAQKCDYYSPTGDRELRRRRKWLAIEAQGAEGRKEGSRLSPEQAWIFFHCHSFAYFD